MTSLTHATTAMTVGVAIAIPEPFGGLLQAHRASFGDPMAGAIPPHVTLLPPTVVPVGTTVQDVGTHLAAVASSATPFAIHLRGTASFRPVSPVVFVSLVEGIGECELLEQQVRRGPLTRELAFPYHPHVTVAHDLANGQLDEAFEALADFDCRFEMREFHLYEHGVDGVWRPEQTYRVGGSSQVGGSSRVGVPSR